LPDGIDFLGDLFPRCGLISGQLPRPRMNTASFRPRRFLLMQQILIRRHQARQKPPCSASASNSPFFLVRPAKLKRCGALHGPPDAFAKFGNAWSKRNFSRGGWPGGFPGAASSCRAGHAFIPFEELFERAAVIEMVEETSAPELRVPFEDQRAAQSPADAARKRQANLCLPVHVPIMAPVWL